MATPLKETARPLRRDKAPGEWGRGGSYVSADGRFHLFRPYHYSTTSHRFWMITERRHSSSQASDEKLLLASGLKGAQFPTRRAALTALNAVAYNGKLV